MLGHSLCHALSFHSQTITHSITNNLSYYQNNQSYWKTISPTTDLLLWGSIYAPNTTCITKNSTSLLDHVLTNSADRVSQFGVVDTGLSDHQLIYCTGKITRTKLNVHKYIKTRSLKNYSQTLFRDKLKKKQISLTTQILRT